jgi:rod shape determining protein RodA
MRSDISVYIKNFFDIDWVMLLSVLLIASAGLLTMNGFVGDTPYFNRQLVWIGIATSVFFIFGMIDWRFLRRTGVVVSLYSASVVALGALLLIGSVTRGIQGWYSFGIFNIQPADPVKLVLIILLAKYFTRRHIEIKNIRHIIVSGGYAFVLFALIFLQPDFGSAVIIFAIWLGVVLVAGISRKHLAIIFLSGVLAFGALWGFVFEDYQKARVVSFVDPYTDLQGTGYNAFQSMVAVGSGQMWGKGVGYGTQSQLKFLPEYQTDFIFAAFAEEWGFVGVVLLLMLYGVLIWRILVTSMYGATNFEMLFGIGLAFLFMSHITINIGMNIGLLPVTGITLAFMSYGGSHLLTEMAGLGILMGMRKYNKTVIGGEIGDVADKFQNSLTG